MGRRIPGNESIVGSLTSVSKTAVIIAFVCLLSLSAAIGAADVPTPHDDGNRWSYFEDFDDGDSGDWSLMNGGSITQNSYESGGYSLNYSYTGTAAEYAEYNNPDLGGDNDNASIYMRQNIGDWDAGGFAQTQELGQIEYSNTDVNFWYGKNQDPGGNGLFVLVDGSAQKVTSDYNLGEWMNIYAEFGEGEMEVYTWPAGESPPEDPQFTTSPSDRSDYTNPDRIVFEQADPYGYLDEASWGVIPELNTVSGDVTDSNNNDLEGVTIEARNESGGVVATDTTDQLGDYSLSVENGTYNVTASKQNYTSETKTVTIAGQDETVNFQLAEFNQSITLDSRMYLEYGQEAPYDVVVSVDGDRRGVTDNATVTSGNTSVVTIDDTEHEVIATNDTSVNQRTYVQAVWTDDEGNTYTTRRNVTVANATVENIQILPDFTRFTASLSDKTVMVIIIATGVGAAAALFATSFAGVSAVTMVMLLGWLAGYVNNGMAILAVLMAMFVGMNVSGSVDYTVRG